MRASIAAVWLVALCSVATAQPSEPRVKIEWLAPAGCPERSAVIARIEAHLGGPLQAEDRPELHARIEVEQHGDQGWRMHLYTRNPDGDGERMIEGATCAEVAEAAALVVALAIDPEAVAATASGETPPPPVEPPPPAEDPELPPDPGLSDGTTPPSLGLRTRTVAAVDFDFRGFGFGLGVAASYGRLELEVTGAYWLEKRFELGFDPPTGGDLKMYAGSVRGCWRLLTLPVISAHGCGGIEVGTIEGVGYGVEPVLAGSARWFAITAGLAQSFPVYGPLYWWFQEDLAVPMTRPRFFISEDDTIYQPEILGIRVFTGLGVRIL